MQDFRKLEVWMAAHQLTLAAYRLTADFPATERFGLTSQIRRAAASIPANIAEGCGRRGNAEFSHFLCIAMGSLSELDYHFLLAHDLGWLAPASYEPLALAISALRRRLGALIAKTSLRNVS